MSDFASVFQSHWTISLLNFRCLFASYYENKQSREEFTEKGKHMWNTRMHAFVHLHLAKVHNNCEHCTVFVLLKPSQHQMDALRQPTKSTTASAVALSSSSSFSVGKCEFIYLFVWNVRFPRIVCIFSVELLLIMIMNAHKRTWMFYGVECSK